ncbi:MAG: hypothetical protein QG574_3058 [Cyanobacteriota bacterium erpe_2018_sw_21hr_WHONDRS-SW48-000092_B_bin.40]|nr:hypothetical protein [Cyanobacteriota bacterium erpe_2018_sw_21hr_WHONDRS-SW48-000092_B_bin.40]
MSKIGVILYLQATAEEGQENLQLQKDAIVSWCNAMKKPGAKVDILDVFEDVCDNSAANRPGLNKALDRLTEDTQVTHFIVWSVQKFGYTVRDILPALQKIAITNKPFVTLTTFPVTPGSVRDFQESYYKHLEGFFD